MTSAGSSLTSTAANVTSQRADSHQLPTAPRLGGIVAGGRIFTPNGYRVIDTLRRGDLVGALIGRGPIFVPIIWIGRRSAADTPPQSMNAGHPVRIRRDAVANSMPSRDVLLAPEHALYWKGQLIQVGQLANHTSIVFEPPLRTKDYWALQLERHDILLAENLPVESLLPAAKVAFTEVIAPPLTVVGGDRHEPAGVMSAMTEFPASLPFSVRWFRRRILARAAHQAGEVSNFENLPPPPADGILDVQVEVRMVLPSFALVAAQRGVTLEYAVEPDLKVRIDRLRLHELLGAMLTHAVHGASGGRVLLGAMRHAGRIQIAVIDEEGGTDRATQARELQSAMQMAAMQGATLEFDLRPGEGTTLLLRMLAP